MFRCYLDPGSTRKRQDGTSKRRFTAPKPAFVSLSQTNTSSLLPSPLSVMVATLPAPLGSYSHLLPPSWKATITAWLHEDTPSFDYGGFVVGQGSEEATLWGKSEVSSIEPLTPATQGYGSSCQDPTGDHPSRVSWLESRFSTRSLPSWDARTLTLIERVVLSALAQTESRPIAGTAACNGT